MWKKITENVCNSFTENFNYLIYISASKCSFLGKIGDGTPDEIVFASYVDIASLCIYIIVSDLTRARRWIKNS